MVVRLLVALLLAIVAIVVLEFSLRPAVHAGGRPGVSGDGRGDAARDRWGDVVGGPDQRTDQSLASKVPGSFYVEVDRVMLCSSRGQAPARAAPLLELKAGGVVVVHRPAPMPQGPARPVSAFAAIILPEPSLAALDARARAVLLDLLAALWPDRPVAVERLVCRGVSAAVSDRRSLLAWLR